MNTPETDLAAAQQRIKQLEEQLCETEQELQAAADLLDEQGISIECMRLQLEAADHSLDEAAAVRRRLERRIADLEEAESDEPCPMIVPVSKGQAPPQQPDYPPGYKPNPIVEAMIGQFRSRSKT